MSIPKMDFEGAEYDVLEEMTTDGSLRISPILIDGKECYVMTIHPSTVDKMKKIGARCDWYDLCHRIRWERRYGELYPGEKV